MGAISYWNPYTNKLEFESVYGGKAIEFLYENKIGQKFSNLLAQHVFSELYGVYQDSALSKRSIPKFIKRFHINMDEFENGPFNSFNDFFIRRFLPGQRTFCENPNDLPAFAEGRYLAFERVSSDIRYPVKGKYLSQREILHSTGQASSFMGGPMVIARLCPTDYHRFHFPDEGEIYKSWRVPGEYQSVNPAALRYKKTVFMRNERQVTLIKTKNFGLLALVEVGALFVGKILQSYSEPYFRRGDEKGFFLFGASTVILMGEPNSFTPTFDIIERSKKGLETFIRLGDKIATR